jgi:diaminopimelate epimerase
MIVWKGEALGNDYLVVERTDLPWPLTPARCAAICDRHTGLGSDGILIHDASAGEGFRVQILNPDGSEAEKSGNGLRIFGAYVYGLGLVTDDWFAVRLVNDVVRLRVEGRTESGALDIRVEMGRASFRAGDVAFSAPGIEDDVEVLGYTLPLPDGPSAEINTVSLSNPHCVVLVDALIRDDFLKRAPQLCTHAAFTRGTNVQFAHVLADDVLEILIWERGVGETLASGSSACAAAAAAVRRGLMPAGRIVVRMIGGTAEVTVLDDFEIRLRGPARMVYRAVVTPGAADAWSRLV